MQDDKYPAQSWKVLITQETEVTIYFQEGIIAEDDDTLYDIICESALQVMDELGLVAKLHEETETSNGFLAYIEDVAPQAEVVYNYKGVSRNIAEALEKRGMVIND